VGIDKVSLRDLRKQTSPSIRSQSDHVRSLAHLRLVVRMRVWLHQHPGRWVLEARCRADNRYRRRTDTDSPPRQILHQLGGLPRRLIVSLNSFSYTAPKGSLIRGGRWNLTARSPMGD